MFLLDFSSSGDIVESFTSTFRPSIVIIFFLTFGTRALYKQRREDYIHYDKQKL